MHTIKICISEGNNGGLSYMGDVQKSQRMNTYPLGRQPQKTDGVIVFCVGVVTLPKETIY